MRRWPSLLSLPVLCLAGCGRGGALHSSPTTPPPPNAPTAREAPRPTRLVDVTRQAGIDFNHHTGAFGSKWFPETNGAGAAFFDYDGDGFSDLFLVNGRDWSPAERRAAGVPPGQETPATPSRLYHNRGDGTFEDATAGSGLAIPMYGMGCAVGDYDNDGDADLYVTGVGRGWLFRNDGKGRFAETARSLGLEGVGWGTSATWLDLDRDGRLDLFVCHYVAWKAKDDQPCRAPGNRPIYCGPNLYPPEPSRLYRQKKDGTFEDISRASGIWGPAAHPLRSKAMGVVTTDFDQDGWPDLLVANDTEPNFLFHNKHDGTFAEEGLPYGIAIPNSGQARSGMGIDTGDWDESGRESVLIGNFAEEMLGLYRLTGDGSFTDVADRVGVGAPSRSSTTFGCLFADLNNDGWLDIVAANGHIDERMEKGNAVPLRQRPLFLMNQSGTAFHSHPYFEQALVGRGLAAADIDRNGTVDLLITTNGGEPVLLRNEGREGQSMRLVLEGTRANRSALGAVVTASVGKRTIRRRIKGGCAYLSASELPLTLGLGAGESAIVTVQWPGGASEELGNLAAGKEHRIREGSGVVATTSLAASGTQAARLSK